MIVEKADIIRRNYEALPFKDVKQGLPFRTTPYSKTFLKVDRGTMSDLDSNAVALGTGESYFFEQNRIVFLITGKFVEIVNVSI